MDDSSPIDWHDLPEKPGGRGWRTAEVTAAYLRAKGKSWAEVSEVVGYTVETVRRYTQRDWWPPIFEHCQAKVLEERRQELEREELEKAREFEEREDRLTREGVVVALETLIATMEGQPLKDPETGDYIRTADGKLRYPSHQARALAARDFLKAVGYEKGKQRLAEMMIEQAEAERETERAAQADGADVRIVGVDQEPEDGGEGSE